MSVTFLTPSQIFEQYKTTLKGLRPDINENDPSGEILIRGRVLTGLVSGLYGDQLKIDNDTFIKDCRSEALLRHGSDLGIAKQPATPATTVGAEFSGTPGTVIPINTQVRYVPSGITYSLLHAVTIAGGGSVLGTLQANTNGQVGNVAAGSVLVLVSPVFGVNTSVSLSIALADGADIETDDSYRARLLSRLQNPPAGGNQADYPTFAFSADPSVRSAFIRRFGRGLGTVDVYITAGTTDIDTAVTQGETVIRIPSPTVISIVQSYYDAHVPLTDCPRVFAPTETPINVSVNVALAAGLTLSSSIPADATYNPLGLNVGQLIQREVSRVLYKVPVGGRRIPGQANGFIVASDIETQLDIMLSAVPDLTGTPQGKIPVLLDREVQKLNGSNYNYEIIGNQLATPGTITPILGV